MKDRVRRTEGDLTEAKQQMLVEEALHLVREFEALTDGHDDQAIKIALAFYWGIFVAAHDDKPSLRDFTADLMLLAREPFEQLRDWRGGNDEG